VSLMTIAFVFILLSFLISNTVANGKLYISQSQKKLIVVTFVLALYFVAHEFIFGDGLVSAKYCVFLLILCISLMARYNVFFIFKILGYLGGGICFLLVAQQLLLLSFDKGDISGLDVVIKGEDWGRWESCNFVKPFGIGLMERCDSGQIWLGEIGFNRSLFFSTEPKYIASILLITLSSLLISSGSPSARRFFIALHFIALSFVLSASAILIVLASWLLVYLRFVGPLMYTLLVFLFPVLVFPVVISYVVLGFELDGFLLNRAMSGASSIGSGELQNISIFGQAFGTCDDRLCRDSKGLISNVIDTYGLLGLGIFGTFFYYVATPMFGFMKDELIPFSKKFALALMLNTYVVFNIYFFGDLFNMFGLLIILSIVLLPGYLSIRSSLSSESQSKLVVSR